MSEGIQSYKQSTSGWALRCAAVAGLLLLSAESSAWAQEQTSAYSLAVGQPVMRDMRGGDQHTYQVKLNAGQYARIALEQKGIDVVLALLGADGKPLLEVDNNLSGTRGTEVISLVAEVSGPYLLTVRPLEKDATAGRYEIRIEDLRTATETDRKRVVAERSYFAGAQLQSERTGEGRRKANERFGETLRLMRDAGDGRAEAMTLTHI